MSVLKDLIFALIECAYDKEESVRHQVCSALHDIGRNKPELVVTETVSYLKNHPKLNKAHRIQLLNTLNKVMELHLNSLSRSIHISVIQLAANEMSMSYEIIPDWQTAASAVLVTVGLQYPEDVAQNLLLKMPVANIPHFFTLQTLGQLASSNCKIVPLIKQESVFTRMLPMMGAVKQDNIKWAFATCIARLCEAIVNFTGDKEEAAKAGVFVSDFEGEVFSTYEILFNLWINTKEAKLRLAIMDGLGYMSALLAPQTLEEQCPKIFNGIIGLYRKHQEHFYITQCLCLVLTSVINRGILLEPSLELLISSLYQMAAQPVDPTNTYSIKNRNETWRTFSVIAKRYSDRIISSLMAKIEPVGEKTRITALEILRHLVNSVDEELEDKKPLILNGLKIACPDPNLKIRRAMLLLITAMAHKNYLNLEGGEAMIMFVVQQASGLIEIKDKKDTTPTKSGDDMPSVSEIKKMATDMLLLMSTTLPILANVLWPYLLEFIMPVVYTESIGVVSRCIAYIAAIKRENKEEDFELDYDVQVNIPKPNAIICRLLTLSGVPVFTKTDLDIQNGYRGVHTLKLLQVLCPNLHEDIVTLWDAAIPKLIMQLNDQIDKGSFNQKSWEDIMLKLVSRTLDEVDEEEWLCELVRELNVQIYNLYNDFEAEKAFLYKIWGVMLRKITNKQFLLEQITVMFGSIKHTRQLEREGMACGVGLAAASHLDQVLEKLEQVTTKDMVRKSTGLFGLSKDKSEADIEKMKSTVMLCYGYSSFYAPPNLITSRMEVTIFRSINPHFLNVKDQEVKQNLIKTVDLIGKSLHPTHLGNLEYVFTHRKELIGHILRYIRQDSKLILINETRTLCLQALTTLVKLDPPLSEPEQLEILVTCLEYIIGLPDVRDMNPGKKEANINVSIPALYEEALQNLSELLNQLILKRLNEDNLVELFRNFLPYYSMAPIYRARSINLWKQILNFYLEGVKAVHPQNPEELQNTNNNLQPLSCLAELLGYLVPKTTDSVTSVRVDALRSCQLILLINNKCLGANLDTKDKFIEALSILMTRAESDEGLFNLASDLGRVLAKKIPDEMVITFIGVLTQGLLDTEVSSASGAVVVLNQTLKHRGQKLADKLPEITHSIIEKLSHLPPSQNRTGTLRCIRTFANFHLHGITTLILESSDSLSNDIIEIWQCLSKDPNLNKALLEILMDTLDRSLPFQEKVVSGVTKYTPTNKPSAVIRVYAELFQFEELLGLLQEHYARLFSQLITRIGVCAIFDTQVEKGKSKDTPNLISEVLTALSVFLKVNKQEDIVTYMEQNGYWCLMSTLETYPQGLTHLANTFCMYAPGNIPRTIQMLNAALSSIYDPYRIVASAFFAELINQSFLTESSSNSSGIQATESINRQIVEQLINSLLGRLVDSHYTVRMLCVRGLGNIASHNQDIVKMFSTTVLSAMMSGMDDKEDPYDGITMEAMYGLGKIIAKIDEGHVRPILINIILRIRPCFEKVIVGVRTAAISLFGDLSQFGDGPSKVPYLEQIFANLVTFLLHTNESEQDVVKACKRTIQRIGPLMGCEEVNSLFQQHLDPNRQILYNEFLNTLAKPLCTAFPDKINFFVLSSVVFLKSRWSEIRSAAALFIGFMLHHTSADLQDGISKEQVSQALIALLQDSVPEVRGTCATCISLLSEY